MLYNQFNGVVLEQQEGINVASALGSNKVCDPGDFFFFLVL